MREKRATDKNGGAQVQNTRGKREKIRNKIVSVAIYNGPCDAAANIHVTFKWV